jgi:CBS domain-containing membrane protein
MRNRPISSIMSTDPITVERSQPLSEVWDVLELNKFHHVPVVDGAKLVGIISSADILRLVYDVDREDSRMLRTMLDYQFTIDDAMTAELVTLPTGATVHDAAELLSDGAIHSVLVVDGSGDLAGIVTSTDLIRYLRDQTGLS